ncbi:hypothetical protein FISHEDRAFT_13679, partial [Fistulina hepatica ATCC 64428]
LITPTDWPKWVLSGVKTLRAEARGERWKTLISDWLKYEEKLDFASSARKLDLTSRPPAVHWWIQRGRCTAAPPPKITGDHDKFGAAVIKWWNALNPSWRVRDAASGTLIQTGIPDGWDSLDCGGPNGLLSVLACLAWWHDLNGGNATPQWVKIVEDVHWV